MAESDTKFEAFKSALREYLLSNCREFIEQNPDHPSLQCLTRDVEWEKKFESIWMMFPPRDQSIILDLIQKTRDHKLLALAKAFVAGGAYLRRMHEALQETLQPPMH